MNLVNSYLGGEAVLDTFFMVKRANHIFYQFMGNNVIYSFPKMIYVSDVDVFYKAVKYAEESGVSYAALRILSAEKDFRWYILCMQKEQSISRAEYTILLRDAERLHEELYGLKDICTLYEQYFKLWDHYMIQYEMDTKKFKILPGDQREALFEGTFKTWMEIKLNHGDIDPEYLNTFHALCQSIQAGKHFFQYKINVKLGENQEKQLYVFKGKTLFRNNGQKYVLMTAERNNSGDKKMDESMMAELFKDVGTDLINKRAITKYATDLIGSKPDYPITLVILDLDNFKYINDTYGHMFGDDVLCRVAEILNGVVGNRGAVGRIGGDEMMIVLKNIPTESKLRVILREIRMNVEGAYKKNEDAGNILSCSMGVASYPKDASNYEKLFQIADRCLYIAKEKGKNRYVIYEKEIHKKYMEQGLNGDSEESSHNKLSLINFMIEQCVCPSSSNFSLQQACTKVGECFGLDSIDILEYKCGNIQTRYIWDIKLAHGDESLDLSYYKWDCLSNQNYICQFDENNILVIDNIESVDSQIYLVKANFEARMIRASVQYIVGDRDRPSGFILFNRGRLSRKWAEIDISYLFTLAKLIGIKIFPDRIAIGMEKK